MVNRIQGFKFKKKTGIPKPPKTPNDENGDQGDDDGISRAELVMTIVLTVCCLVLYFTICLTGILAISWIFLGGVFDHYGVFLRLYAVAGVVLFLCIACSVLVRYLEQDK